MKKFLSAIVLTSIIFSGFSPLVIFAQEVIPGGSTAALGQAQTLAGTISANDDIDDAACWSFLGGLNVGSCIRLAFAGTSEVIVWIVSRILWIANEVFNLVVTLSIRDFHKYVDSDGINNAWKAIRDVVNIFFIFILLYIAISTMFELPSSKGMLKRVIIVALLINFSALLPKVVIDASNLLALEFYGRIGDGETITGSPNLTQAIISNLGLWDSSKGWLDTLKQSEGERPDLPGYKLSIAGIIAGHMGTIVLILVTAFIIAAAAWMFIMRTVVLIFLIVLSPAAIIAITLPKTEQYFKMWLSKLFNQAFFAPAYLFLLYVVISIVKGTNLAESVGSTTVTAELFNADVIKVVLNFTIITVMMGAALIIASKMGARGADTVTGWGKSLKGFALGATVGTAGAYTLGKAAKAAAGSDKLTGFAARNPFLGGLARDTLNKIAGQKYAGGASYTERVEKAAKRIEGFKTPELQAQYLASLSEIDRKAAYKNLSDRQKAELHEYTDEQLNTLTTGAGGTSANANLISNYRKVSAIKPKTGTEDYEKLEAEKKKIIDRKNTQEAIDALKAAPVAPPPPPGTPPPIPGSPPVPPTPQQIKLQRQQSLGKIRGKNINKIDVATLVKPDVAPYFSIQHLAALKDHPEMDQTHRDAIRSAIEAAVGVTAANRTPTIGAPEQQKVYNWLETGGGVDF